MDELRILIDGCSDRTQAVYALSKNCHAQAVFSGLRIYGKTFLDDVFVMSCRPRAFRKTNVSQPRKNSLAATEVGSAPSRKRQGTS
jgi:hypothetical protein